MPIWNTHFTRQHHVVILASVNSGLHVIKFAARRTRRADMRTLRQVAEGPGDNACLFDVTLNCWVFVLVYMLSGFFFGVQRQSTLTFNGYCPRLLSPRNSFIVEALKFLSGTKCITRLCNCVTLQSMRSRISGPLTESATLCHRLSSN